MIYEVSWCTNDYHASDDDVINGIREAICRHCDSWNGIPKPSQPGDCVIISRDLLGQSGLAHVVIDGNVPKRYSWFLMNGSLKHDLDIEVLQEISSSEFLTEWFLREEFFPDFFPDEQ